MMSMLQFRRPISRPSTKHVSVSGVIIAAERLRGPSSPFDFILPWSPCRRRNRRFGARGAVRHCSMIHLERLGVRGHCAVCWRSVEREGHAGILCQKNVRNFTTGSCRGRWTAPGLKKCPSDSDTMWDRFNFFAVQRSLRQREYSQHNNNRRRRSPDLRQCKSIEDLACLVDSHLDDMTPSSLGAFWTFTAKFLQKRSTTRQERRPNGNQMHDQLNRILSYTMHKLGSFGYKDFAQTTLGLAKVVKQVGNHPGKNVNHTSQSHQVLRRIFVDDKLWSKDRLFHSIAFASMPVLRRFDPRHLSNFIYAFGLVGFVPKFDDGKTLFDHVALQASPKLNEFNAHDLSNMLWAYANVNVGSSNSFLFASVGDVIAELATLDRFKPQDLSNIAWAYASAGVSRPQLYEKFGHHIISLENLDEFNPQSIANIAWAYAAVGESHPKLFQKFGHHIVNLPNLNAFNPQNLSNIAWAYSTAGESNPQLFEKLRDHIVALPSFKAFHPQTFSNIAWAYATAGGWHPQLFSKIGDNIVALDSLNAFKPQELANIAWAYATTGKAHPTLFQKIGDHIDRHGNLEKYKPQALANISWAYATAGEPHPLLLEKIRNTAIEMQSEFSSQAISNILWAYAQFGNTDRILFHALVPSVQSKVDECSCQAICDIAWAYAVANVAAPRLFDDEFIRVLTEKQDDFILEDLCKLHQWCLWQQELTPGVKLPPALQEMCFDAFISQYPTTSSLQSDVMSELSSMGLKVEEEVLTGAGYRLDGVVEVDGEKIGIEVDGPTHFHGRERTGSNLIKRRQVANIDGILVVSVPYWEWGQLEKGTSCEKHVYLRSLLDI